MRNRLWNVSNPYQGNFKKILCVCSAGLLRSPTIAWVLSQEPYNYNTRAVGVHDYALIPIDRVHIAWADTIICAEKSHEDIVRKYVEEYQYDVPVINLGIPDEYEYRNPTLINIIKERYEEFLNAEKKKNKNG